MKMPHLRIASYNLQKCVGLDMRRRPDRSLQVINSLNAEIVVLQEVDKRLPPRPAALPHDLLERDGWKILPFGAPGGSLGWHGNAMLARGNLSILHTQHLDLPGLEPRGAVLAEMKTRIGNLRIVGVHLGLVRRYRVFQIKAVMRHLARRPPMPLILAGDFNEWGNRGIFDAAAHGVTFSDTPPSYPALRPIARLDRIAHCYALKAVATGTFLAKPAHIASDHLPVWADVQKTT
jgi:endonuclease/exonuclease/phosphatase family metal-dependent hydrolase